MDKEVLQRHLGQGLSLARIGMLVGRHPSTVGYWVRRHGLQAAGRRQYSPRGRLRKIDLAALVEKGASITLIARTLGVSRSTVRYWLRKYGLLARTSVRRREAREAKKAGLEVARMTCQRHGPTDFLLEGRGYYRCLRCRQENVTRCRRKTKATLVKEAGGSCAICGYAHYNGALQFHHIDPGEKEFHPASGGATRSIHQLRVETRKCVLLCSNCHAEVQAGVTLLPT